MPKIVDRSSHRSLIRRAARRVFARRGVKGTGLAHVAEAAGVGRSSLYHYYPDKASLLRDVARELLLEEEAFFRATLLGEGSAIARIERLTSGLASLFDSWAEVGRMLLDFWARDAIRFRPFFRRIRRDLTRVIAQGQTAGEIDRALDPVLAASGVIGIIDGLLIQHFLDPGAFPDRDALRGYLVRAVWKGLQP